MTLLLIALVLTLYFLLYTFLDNIYRKLCIFLFTRKRKCLDDKSILSFYKGSGLSETDILMLWQDVSDVLGVLPGYLRPNDKLAEIVALKFFSDDRIEGLSDMAIEHNRLLDSPIDLQTICTLDDYIQAFSSKNKKLTQ